MSEEFKIGLALVGAGLLFRLLVGSIMPITEDWADARLAVVVVSSIPMCIGGALFLYGVVDQIKIKVERKK